MHTEYLTLAGRAAYAAAFLAALAERRLNEMSK